MKDGEIDLESPRVKNIPLKAYFCLSYFVLVHVKISDKITEEEERMERSLFTEENKMPISVIRQSPEKTEKN